jgi:hypothetical protein
VSTAETVRAALAEDRVVTAPAQSRGGRARIYHTDPQCHVVRDMAAPRTRPASHLDDRWQECSVCEGGRDYYRHRDPDVLEHLYHEEGLSLQETADRLDCARSTVTHWLDEHGIREGSA